MKFFPIVPINYLGKLARISEHHMVLAQLLESKRYRNFYKRRIAQGETIILDNGSCELGRPLPIEDLVWMTQDLELRAPSILVIPDILSDGNTELFRSSVKTLYKVFRGLVKLMAVPHTQEEVEMMLGYEEVDVIGLNRDFQREGGRAKIIQNYRDYGKKFHVLGIYRNPIGEIKSIKPFEEVVIGVDSSLPYSIARSGRRIEEYRPYPKYIDYHEVGVDKELLDFIAGELEYFRGFVEDAKD